MRPQTTNLVCVRCGTTVALQPSRARRRKFCSLACATAPRLDVESRFWAKVEKTDGCWNWTGALTDGYGCFTRATRAMTRAHRIAYEWLVGPIPAEMQLDHLCRNRACVNPAHLEPVTPRENSRRGLWVALKTHCPAGHPWIPDNLVTLRTTGKRRCRICATERGRDWRAAHPGYSWIMHKRAH